MPVLRSILLLSRFASATAALGCAGSAPTGPSFEVSFDSSNARTAREEAVRVEVYLVRSCDAVTAGSRPVPAVASAFVLRDGGPGSFGATPMAGDYGLYGVAQNADCAVVASGCAPVTITGERDILAVTLGRFDGQACAEAERCSIQTGECVEDGAGGAGGTGGSNGQRVEDGLIVLYAFDEGSGSTVFDQSGESPAHDLEIADPSNVEWSADHISVTDSTVLSTVTAATKVANRVRGSGAFTVEAWVRPENAVQGGPARIASMSVSTTARNFLLGQEAGTFAARFRADDEGGWANGSPTFFTADGTATTALTHVVFTHATDGAEAVYLDGLQSQAFTRAGGVSRWDDTYPLVVANEATGDRTWLGELHLIAVYERALSDGEVAQNFAAGP